MSEISKQRALFVTNAAHLSDRVGGVQTCSREYLTLLQAAGFVVEILKVDIDRRWTVRFLRRVRGSPYVGSIARSDLDKVFLRARDVDFVFLNQVSLSGGITRDPRAADLAGKIFLLSHGAEVTDLLNQVREPIRARQPSTRRPSLRTVKTVLEDEILSRQGISAAICLSPFDADFERWLGVERVTWIPRIITRDPLDWQPNIGRFGFLGTLNHVPNLSGLLAVLETGIWKEAFDLNIRVIGGPSAVGRWLAATYPRVDYLGELDDLALRNEARTWTAFLNPIFCQARGCSTKLATALGWEIPIITTALGKRGYVDNEENILTVDNPISFVAAMSLLKGKQNYEAVRAEQANAVHLMPTMQMNALQVREFVLGSPA
jgi:Glycosyl transferases group 1